MNLGNIGEDKNISGIAEVHKFDLRLRLSLCIFIILKCLAMLSTIILFLLPIMFTDFYTYIYGTELAHMTHVFSVKCHVLCLSDARTLMYKTPADYFRAVGEGCSRKILETWLFPLAVP